MPIRILPKDKGRRFRNTRRENRLEELGRVDAEKAYTSRGKRNLRDEKHRIRKELAVGGAVRKIPKHLRDKLKDLTKKGRPSPGRPGGKGPKPDKRWNKGDKFMTPLKGGGRAKGPNRPRPQGPHMWVRGDKRKKYASGGVVMAGKKVGCQIK